MKINGADELVKQLKENANLNDIKNTVKLNTSEMHRKAQRYAPVDTGHLKRGIVIEFEDDGFTGKVASTAEYAMYQEFGTRFQAGTVHIRPAYVNTYQKFQRDLDRLMK